MNDNAIMLLPLFVSIGLALTAWSRHRALKRLEGEKYRAETTLNALPDAVIRLDPASRLDYLNPSAEAMLGARLDTLQGGTWSLIKRDNREPLLDAILANARNAGTARLPAGTLLIDCNGMELEVAGHCRPLTGSGGQIDGYLLQLRDITEEQEWRRQQPDLWDRDPVTALPGRHLIDDRLNRALQNKRAGDLPLSYMHIHLDGIRAVYSQAGTQAGDSLVRHLTALLRVHVRDTDLLARIGMEEFAVLLTRCPAEISRRIGQEALTALTGFSFEWQGRHHPIVVRLGQVDAPPFEGCLDELLQAARPGGADGH